MCKDALIAVAAYPTSKNTLYNVPDDQKTKQKKMVLTQFPPVQVKVDNKQENDEQTLEILLQHSEYPNFWCSICKTNELFFINQPRRS